MRAGWTGCSRWCGRDVAPVAAVLIAARETRLINGDGLAKLGEVLVLLAQVLRQLIGVTLQDLKPFPHRRVALRAE